LPGGPALSSLELAMRRSLDLFGSFALWDNFQLPPKVLLALPRHRERAYARSLRPVVTGLWLLRLGPRPPPPPITSRLSAYLSLTSPELGRRDLFRPAPYLRALPHHPSLPLLRLRCQSSLLPTHLHLTPPPRRYRLYSQRLCPFCPPPSPLGDALHVIFHCHTLAPVSAPFLASIAPLFPAHSLSIPSLDSDALLSLLLAVDPFPHLTGRDRLPWLCEVIPIATTFALALADRLSLDPT